MTESSHNVFVDRRTENEKCNGLATQILFWYDKDSKKRTRTNGIAVTLEGKIIVASATCSRKDQFMRAAGRLKVSSRIFGRAQKHCLELGGNLKVVPNDQIPELAARLYSEAFADEMGAKRAYNIGKVFARFSKDLEARVNA